MDQPTDGAVEEPKVPRNAKHVSARPPYSTAPQVEHEDIPKIDVSTTRARLLTIRETRGAFSFGRAGAEHFVLPETGQMFRTAEDHEDADVLLAVRRLGRVREGVPLIEVAPVDRQHLTDPQRIVDDRRLEDHARRLAALAITPEPER